jgi:hypothetical protein
MKITSDLIDDVVHVTLHIFPNHLIYFGSRDVTFTRKTVRSHQSSAVVGNSGAVGVRCLLEAEGL